VNARALEPPVETQKVACEPNKTFHSEMSCRVPAAQITTSPAVRSLLNFLQRYVTELAKPEKMDDLDEVAGCDADGLPVSSACLEMGQELQAFGCQGC
jgi:hypothetical protein